MHHKYAGGKYGAKQFLSKDQPLLQSVKDIQAYYETVGKVPFLDF
jgi:hypothetical protein